MTDIRNNLSSACLRQMILFSSGHWLICGRWSREINSRTIRNRHFRSAGRTSHIKAPSTRLTLRAYRDSGWGLFRGQTALRRHLSRPSEIITIRASDRTAGCTPLVLLTDKAEIEGCGGEVEGLKWLLAVILRLSNRKTDRQRANHRSVFVESQSLLGCVTGPTDRSKYYIARRFPIIASFSSSSFSPSSSASRLIRRKSSIVRRQRITQLAVYTARHFVKSSTTPCT